MTPNRLRLRRHLRGVWEPLPELARWAADELGLTVGGLDALLRDALLEGEVERRPGRSGTGHHYRSVARPRPVPSGRAHWSRTVHLRGAAMQRERIVSVVTSARGELVTVQTIVTLLGYAPRTIRQRLEELASETPTRLEVVRDGPAWIGARA